MLQGLNGVASLTVDEENKRPFRLLSQVSAILQLTVNSL